MQKYDVVVNQEYEKEINSSKIAIAARNPVDPCIKEKYQRIILSAGIVELAPNNNTKEFKN